MNANKLTNKTILLTGGTGSFGQAFTKIVLSECSPKEIRIFSRGEFLQSEMKRKFGDNPKLRFFIGDTRDEDRLIQVTRDVDIVVHAAALKQVPTCEEHPSEAIKTNITGTVNVIQAAIINNVYKVILISSDKAVHPVNLYGATKMVAEKVIINANSRTNPFGTKFSCVRYGNVVGSRGSIIPLFLEQKKNGIITITDKRMTRFWVTLRQVTGFVVDCIGRMQGREVFIPKIPSMGIMDLAKVIAPEAKIKVIGIRPGEKLHETLVSVDERAWTCDEGNYIVISEKRPLHLGSILVPFPDDFSYTSDNNGQWLTTIQIKELINENSEW